MISACLQEAHAILNGGLSALELPEDGPKDSSAVDIGQHPRDIGVAVTQDLLPGPAEQQPHLQLQQMKAV